MIQLNKSLMWDDTTNFEGQSNEVKNFIQNVIASYDRTSIKEPIPNSSLFRPLSYLYEVENAIVKQSFEYVEPVNSAGWASVKSEKIECYGK
jgi:hypothetical protein